MSRDDRYVLVNTATDDGDEWPDVTELRARTLFRSKQCEHCKTTDLKCERESPSSPCRNCVEGGHADSCVDKPPPYPPVQLQRPPVSTSPARSPSVDSNPSSPTSASSLTCRGLFILVPTSALSVSKSLCKHLFALPLLPHIIHPFLLYLPKYYSSRADALYDNDDPDQILEGYYDWIRQLQRLSQPSNSASTTDTMTASSNAASIIYANANDTPHNAHNSSFVSLTLPAPSSRSPDVAQPSPNVVAMQRQPTLLSSTPSPPPHPSTTPDPPPPDSLGELRAAWLSYLDSCMYQWRISFAVAGFFFCTSPTVFQIQGASEDPVPRTLAFLAVFRAIVGLVHAPAFLHYFGERSEVRSLEFAVLWTRETRTREGGMKCGPWILLSLPASATLWAMVLYALSMLAFMWRVGAKGDPANGGTTAYALRAVMTGVTMVDVGRGVWAWRRMGWFMREVRAMKGRV